MKMKTLKIWQFNLYFIADSGFKMASLVKLNNKNKTTAKNNPSKLSFSNFIYFSPID